MWQVRILLAKTVLRHAAVAPLWEEIGERYPTLNQLNESIVSGNENVWNGNWKYRTPECAWRSIDTLRSQFRLMAWSRR